MKPKVISNHKSEKVATGAIAGEIVELSTGARLFVKHKGMGDELIVFLHSVGADHSMWEPQIEAFADKYACVSLDLRGHAQSTIPENAESVKSSVTIESFAQDVIALINYLGYRQAHLVGLSMGGVVAQEVFKQNRKVVQSLTLANSWSQQADAKVKIDFMTEQLSKMTLAESATQLVPGLFAPGTDQKIIDKGVQSEGSKNKGVFLASWHSMFKVDYLSMLEEIDLPVLVIGGTEDKITPTEPLSTTIHSRVTTSQLVNIEGAGHYSNLDHPEEFNRALRAHLFRARSRASQRIADVPRTSVVVEADTVAHGLVALLNKRGIEYFFSNSGTDFTPIIDGLARYEGDPEFKLKTVIAPHENTSIAMAHGYYLLSGKPACVMGHVNVGTANMGLGIINASRSRIPMLVMSGKTPWYESRVDGCRTNFVQWGQDTFDQAAYFREFTKWDYELKGPHNLESAFDRALAISQSDPQGPVYLTLPKEALCEEIDDLEISSLPRQLPTYPQQASETAIAKAARLMVHAKKPLILVAELGRYAGGVEALVQLAQKLAIPVIEFGKRNFFNFPTEHPMHLGFWPSPFVEESDLVIAVENPVPWIPELSAEFSKGKEPPTMIQIGVDPLCQKIPMRSFPTDVILAGDPASTLRSLTNAVLANKDVNQSTVRSRFESIASDHRKIFDNALAKAKADGDRKEITKQYLSYCIGQAIDDECVIFNEYNLDPQLIPRNLPDCWFENSIASGLGWSLGAALGGQLACPDKTMVVTLGDGTYLFNTPLSAHYVASAYKLPVLIIVFNDSAWSTIKKSYLGTTPNGWAEKKDFFPLCNFDINVKFEKVAESCGGIGVTVNAPEQLLLTLKQALRTVRQDRKHVLVNVICQRDV